MTLVVTNTTGSNIEILELGITVPASDSYDLSYRPSEIIGASAELAGHIKSGNITVTADTLNALANATGYFQVISGPPSERPVSPPDGTMRHNANTNITEVYQGGAWQNLPNLANTVLAIDTITGIPVRYDHIRNKYLSLAIIPVSYANANSADKSWLYINSNINHSQAGYVAPILGTILTLSLFTDMQVDKTVSVYVNNTEYANVVTFTGAQNANAVVANIDFSPGDNIRLRVRSAQPGNVGAVYANVFVSIRGIV